ASASNSAFYYTHTTQEAARLIFMHGLWPAAQAIWTRGIGGGQASPYVVRREDARWVKGMLTANGMQPLSLAQLAGKAYEMGLVVGAVVHGFNRWQWAEADFVINEQTERLPLDGMALCFAEKPGDETRPHNEATAASNPTDGAVTSIDAGPDDTLGTKSTTQG